MNLVEILREIRLFMRYFAPGYLFLRCMEFAQFRRREQDSVHLIAKCVTASFILTAIVDTVMGQTAEALPLLILAVAGGIGIGWLRRTDVFRHWVEKIFGQSVKSNLIEELKNSEGKALYVKISVKGEKRQYLGSLEKIVAPYDQAQWILKNYTVMESVNGQAIIVENFCGQPEMSMVIPFEKIDTFEYMYTEAM